MTSYEAFEAAQNERRLNGDFTTTVRHTYTELPDIFRGQSVGAFDDREEPKKCWIYKVPGDLSSGECRQPATSKSGLCFDHLELLREISPIRQDTA